MAAQKNLNFFEIQMAEVQRPRLIGLGPYFDPVCSPSLVRQSDQCSLSLNSSNLDQTSNHEGKISPGLQNTPPGTPGVSKNSQKYFTNKSVDFFLVNFIKN